eukprot:jgi/Mesen1/9229/ME000595S08638
MASNKGKRILFIVGDFVEDYEVMVPFQALEAYGFNVDAVCPGKHEGDKIKTAVHDFIGDQTYSEKPGHKFSLNAAFSEARADDYDALVIPGGRAPEYLSINESVLTLVRAFAAADKPIASICHGQLILAAAGVLKGKKCTAYPAVKPAVQLAGANWQDPEPITVCFRDGNLITGAAWPAHPQFLQLLLEALGATVENGDKKILMILGDYVEDYEVMVPFQAMLALGYQVDAVCPNKKSGDTCATAIHDFEGDQTYTEKPGHRFQLTASFEDVTVDHYDALVIPGGRAPEYLSINEKVLDIVRSFSSAKKPIASICHGPQVLAAAGILNGKKCTAHPTVRPTVEMAGAEFMLPEPIVKCFTDGTLVTGAAWPAHPQFIAQLAAVLGTTITMK